MKRCLVLLFLFLLLLLLFLLLLLLLLLLLCTVSASSVQDHENPEQRVLTEPLKGNFAIKMLKDRRPDCRGAIEAWGRAYYNFDGQPPPFSSTDALYGSSLSQSFVAVYNPAENPTADCRVIKCTGEAISAHRDSTRHFLRLSEAAARQRGLATPQPLDGPDSIKIRYGLVCLTAPNALRTGRTPYT